MNNSINSENLTHIEFERSKVWATFLNKVSSSRETDAEIDLNNEIELLDDDLFPQEKAVNCEEAVESDESEIEEEMTIRCAMQTANISTASSFKLNRSYVENNDAEMLNFCDQTIPILEEYKRNLKVSGMERILQTFDAQKIEDRVGSWMRENQFECTLPSEIFAFDIGRTSKAPSLRLSRRSDPTMARRPCQLMETPSHPHCHKKPCQSVTTTKTSARQKYAASIDEHVGVDFKAWQQTCSDHKHKLATESHQVIRHVCCSKQLFSCCCNGVAENISAKDRNYKSEDDEDEAANAPRCRKCLIFLKQPTRHSFHCGRSCCQQSYPSTSSEESLINKILKLQIASCQHAIKSQRRSSKRESECSCFNDENLCDEFRHVAVSSNEKWLVENCTPIKKSLNKRQPVTVSSNHTKRFFENGQTNEAHYSQNSKTIKNADSKGNTNKKANYITKKMTNQETSKAQNTPISTRSAGKKTATKNQETSKAQNTPKSTRTAGKKTAKRIFDDINKSNNERSSETFIRDLNLAIENSKQTYQQEYVNSKIEAHALHQSPIVKEKQQKTPKFTAQNRKNPGQKLTTIDEVELPIGSNDVPSNTFNPLHETVRKPLRQKFQLPEAKTFTATADDTSFFAKPGNMRNSTTLANDSSSFFAKPGNMRNSTTLANDSSSFFAKPGNIRNSTAMANDSSSFFAKPGNIRNSTAMANDSSSFFAKPGNIRNSTAMANDTAMNRQIVNTATAAMGKLTPAIAKRSSTIAKKKTKCYSEAGSSAQICGNRNSATPDAALISKDNDCTKVTSTTSEFQTSLRQQRILVYSPNNDTFAPKITCANGYFNITESLLSEAIGANIAHKLFKYSIIRHRSFRLTSKVYYIPPLQPTSDTESEDDSLELMDKYGILHESFDRSNAN